MNSIKNISLLIVFFSPFLLTAQQMPEMGSDFFTYTREMDQYYLTHGTGKGTGYNQYRRWKHHVSCKAGAEGILKNFEAIDIDAYQKVVRTMPSIPTRETHGYWEDLGPYDYYVSDSYASAALGRVNAIAFHPTDPDILFAGGPVGGLWKTVNHGDTWECITNNFPSIGISDIAVNPANPQIIYILTGDGDGRQSNSVGVLKTTDGGITWKKTGLTFGVNNYVTGYCLRINPTDPEVLYAGCRDNNSPSTSTLYVTYDGGTTWTGKIFDNTVYDIEFKPGDANTIYAGTYLGMYRSMDNGESFNPFSAGIPMDSIRLAVAVTPDDPEYVYVLCGAVLDTSMFAGVCRSTNSGTSYNVMYTYPNILGYDLSGQDNRSQAGYDLCIAVDPADKSTVFVGAINGWISINSGINWDRKTWWQRTFGEVEPYVHADWHNVYFKGSRIYSANDGGIFYTDDYGNNWSEISSGLGITQFYNIDVHNGEYIGGTQDNGTNEGTIGNFQMHNIEGGDGFGCTWHNEDQSIKIISTQSSIVRRQFGTNLYINEADNKFWHNDLKMATNMNHVFSIMADTNLIRGHQNVFPHDWTWYSTGAGPMVIGHIKGFRQSVSHPDVMYVASEYRLLKSDDIYMLPTAPWEILPDPDSFLYYVELAIDSFDANRLWVVCGGYQAAKKVFRSEDGGMTWINITGSLPNIPMRCIEASTTGMDELYVGTEIGVFYWNETINDWIYFSNGLPAVSVYDLKIYDGDIYAGTFGRGIWKSASYTSCPATIDLTVTDPYSPHTPGKQFYSASNSIVSNRVYSGSLGTEIHYHAEGFVDLTPGFWSKAESFLEAKIEGCPD